MDLIHKRQWHIKDKWKRHLALMGNRKLMKHIPPTRQLNESNLRIFLGRYRVIFVKPALGAQGNGILKLTRGQRDYLVQYEDKVQRVPFNSIQDRISHHVRRKQEDIRRIQWQMNEISLLAAEKFGRRYRHCRRMGVDLAIDHNQNIWILEVNTNPAYDLFRHHSDKSIHGKIERFMN
jgi:hypothetical protein